MRKCLILFAFIALIVLVSAGDRRKTIPAHVPATHGTIHTNFLISATGETENGLFSFNIKNNVGTFTIRGQEYVSVAYYTQGTLPIGTDGARWIDFIGVSTKQDDLAWMVFQCEPIDNATTIEAVYEEDYSHMGMADPSDAECNFVDLSGKPDATIPVRLPAIKRVPIAGTVDSNVTILGDNVFLDRAGPGWVVIDSKMYVTVPINTIPCPNCGGDCEDCFRSPWYETHVAFYNQELTEVGFGIFYMYPYNRTFVQFNYTIMLPSLKTPSLTFKAHWYGDPMADELLDLRLPPPQPLKPSQPQQPQQAQCSSLKKHSGRPLVGKSVFTWQSLCNSNNPTEKDNKKS